jgi:hypothetical protein
LVVVFDVIEVVEGAFGDVGGVGGAVAGGVLAVVDGQDASLGCEFVQLWSEGGIVRLGWKRTVALRDAWEAAIYRVFDASCTSAMGR